MLILKNLILDGVKKGEVYFLRLSKETTRFLKKSIEFMFDNFKKEKLLLDLLSYPRISITEKNFF